MNTPTYSIGQPGQPWTEREKAQWLAQQAVQRSYQDEVISRLNKMPDALDVVQYGALPYDEARYPLFALVSKDWQADKLNVLVTGGVHGYETSGVQGAIRFAQQHLDALADNCNFIVLPCISPWGYETINRWNPYAIDPNRSFFPDSPAPESASAMAFLASVGVALDVHIDLHETTDTDNSEFRPALAARDGITSTQWEIPDGFYGVGDTSAPQPDFQRAIIDEVRTVTHIAPADAEGRIIGVPIEQEGVINYDKRSLFLCGGFAGGTYIQTTEVYPDSPQATDEICIQAQVAAILGGVNYVVSQHAKL